MGQPLHEIIMETTILYTGSNKLEELVHERTVWVLPICALCIGKCKKWTATQVRQAIPRIYVDIPVKPEATVMSFYL